MREIKFRGFNRKNGIWLYGFYLQNRGAHFVCPDEFADGKSWDDYEIDPETRGEYTGLKDKNGWEIYEGDIVKRKGFYPDYEKEFKCVIGWSGAGWRATKPIGIHSASDWPLSTPGIIEVIGNIHDNPELLNKQCLCHSTE